MIFGSSELQIKCCRRSCPASPAVTRPVLGAVGKAALRGAWSCSEPSLLADLFAGRAKEAEAEFQGGL